MPNRLTIMEKKQLCRYKDENPDVTFKKMSEIFSVTFGRPLSRSTVSRTLKFRAKIENIPENRFNNYDELVIHANQVRQTLESEPKLKADTEDTFCHDRLIIDELE